MPALAARLSPLRCGQTVSAPAAAAPPHHAPAAAVERPGKARRRAPFVRPATVRGWVSRRIGPLVLGVAVVREQKSKSLCRDHWARARAPSPRPFPPHSGTPPDRAAAARGHFCHTPSVRRLAGRFGAKRWSIGRTAGRPSLTQASGSHRGRLRRPGAALEGPQAQRRRIVRVAQSPTRPEEDLVYLAPAAGVVHYPPRKHRRPILFRGVSGNQPTSRGGVVSGHNKNRFFPPFPGILEPPNLIYFFLIWSLFSTPYFTHFFPTAFVSDIYKSPVPRKRRQMGYTRLCKRLTIVRAKCAGAIHLTVRRVPGRAWAQLLLEEESCATTLATVPRC